jgi:CheY-like chemotaxis protein
MPINAKKILVVDDDFAQRDLYQQIFSDNGFEVILGSDGQDAWEKLQKTPVDLLFTGIDMPRMGGFTLLEKFRTQKENMHKPVIIFSHLGRPEDQMKAKKFLNVFFMVKGYDGPLKILKKVQDLLLDKSDSPVEGPPMGNSEDDDRPANTMI